MKCAGVILTPRPYEGGLAYELTFAFNGAADVPEKWNVLIHHGDNAETVADRLSRFAALLSARAG